VDILVGKSKPLSSILHFLMFKVYAHTKKECVLKQMCAYKTHNNII